MDVFGSAGRCGVRHGRRRIPPRGGAGWRDVFQLRLAAVSAARQRTCSRIGVPSVRRGAGGGGESGDPLPADREAGAALGGGAGVCLHRPHPPLRRFRRERGGCADYRRGNGPLF